MRNVYKIPFEKYQEEKCKVCMNNVRCEGVEKNEIAERCMIMCAVYGCFK